MNKYHVIIEMDYETKANPERLHEDLTKIVDIWGGSSEVSIFVDAAEDDKSFTPQQS